MPIAALAGDFVSAQSLTEDGIPPRQLRGILEIIEVEPWEFYPAFTAYFVDGREADEATIHAEPEAAEPTAENFVLYKDVNLLASASLILQKVYDHTQIYQDHDIFNQVNKFYSYFKNDCHAPDSGRFCESVYGKKWERALKTATHTPDDSGGGKFWLSPDGKFVAVRSYHSEISGPGIDRFARNAQAIRISGLSPTDVNIEMFTKASPDQVEAIWTHLTRPDTYVESWNDTHSKTNVEHLTDPTPQDVGAAVERANDFIDGKVKVPSRLRDYLEAEAVELANDCHSPEDGKFCGDASHDHKAPADIHEAVYMAGERFGGHASGGTEHYQNMQEAASRIAAGKDVGNKLNTRSGKELADKDAALLMAALPATSKNAGTLYRGTTPDEGSPYDPAARGQRELSPGDEITLPLTAVTLDLQVAQDRVYNRGAIYEFPEGSTPFIPIQGIVGGLSEGITGGKFRVKAVDYESNLDGVTETQRVILEHTADHGAEARKQMKDNGWTFGPDLSLQASAEFAKRKGNFEALRRWYNSGGGAEIINWGTERDFTRCMRLVSKYIPAEDAGGFCQNRYMETHGGEPHNPQGENHEAALEAETMFANTCHDPGNGRFCETPGAPGHEDHARVPGEGNVNATERDEDWFYGPDELRGSTMWPDGVRPLATQYAKDVTEDEWQALRGYTTNDYRYVNRRLDEPDAYNAEPEYADAQIKLIDSALEKAPTFPEPIEVYRGVAMPHLTQAQVKAYVDKTYTPGAEISMSKGGYQSTSLGVESPLDQSLSKTNNGFLFEIQAKRGAPLMGSTTFLDESEVLMSRHDRFEVVNVFHDVTFIKGVDQDEVQRTIVQVRQI